MNIKKEIKKLLYKYLNPKQKIQRIIKKPNYVKLSLKDYKYWYKENLKLAEELKLKYKNGDKIKVAFLVHWTSSWSSEIIMQKMLQNPLFEVSIIVAPTTIYNDERMRIVYNQNLAEIKEKYSQKVEIREALDIKTGKIIDKLEDCQIVFIPSNDEKIEFAEYKIYNILQKKILACYVCYSYYAVKNDAILSDTYNLCWKVFVENELNLEDLRQRQPLQGLNANVTGYPKCDLFENLIRESSNRKKIIIAPHHSINGFGLQSQFLKYSELFLKLPELYPDIDFIFRPHPLLYDTLVQPQYWGEEKTKKYYEQISSYKNCVYDTEPEYYQSFVNSHGIIHDCGSFLPEYMFSENPPCYLLKNKDVIDEYFGDLGKKCLEHCYLAFNKNEIINYIENIVIKEQDTMKNERKYFAENVLKYNFPKASFAVIENILNSLNIKEEIK